MEAKAYVTPTGEYVRSRKKSTSSSQSPSRPIQSKAKPNVSHYITMLKTRIALTNTAGAALAKAAVIAVRYSAVRHQGFKSSTANRMDAPEHAILDYQNQLFRCLQWTSTAYAIKFVARWLLSKRKKMESKMKRGLENHDLPEVHANAAGLKAVCCCMAADGIEDLRRSCGGHGYLMSSGIAALELDYKGTSQNTRTMARSARTLTLQRSVYRAEHDCRGRLRHPCLTARAIFDQNDYTRPRRWGRFTRHDVDLRASRFTPTTRTPAHALHTRTGRPPPERRTGCGAKLSIRSVRISLSRKMQPHARVV